MGLDLEVRSDTPAEVLDGAREHIRRCYSLVTSNVSVSEFYAQVARLEGEPQADIANKLSIVDEKLAYASALQQQDASYLDVVASHIKQAELYANLAKQLTSQTEIERNRILATEAIQQARENQKKARQVRAECYNTAREIAEIYWNYLPIEDQIAFESWAKKEAAKQLETLEEKSEELAKAVVYFVISVFNAVEKSKSIPKLTLELIESQKASKKNAALLAIQDLTQKLVELPNVVQVKAISQKPGDLHEIIFQLQAPSEVNGLGAINLKGELWEEAENLVVETEWKLRDTTNEEWYFEARLVNRIDDDFKGAEVAASRNA